MEQEGAITYPGHPPSLLDIVGGREYKSPSSSLLPPCSIQWVVGSTKAHPPHSREQWAHPKSHICTKVTCWTECINFAKMFNQNTRCVGKSGPLRFTRKMQATNLHLERQVCKKTCRKSQVQSTYTINSPNQTLDVRDTNQGSIKIKSTIRSDTQPKKQQKRNIRRENNKRNKTNATYNKKTILQKS